MSTYKDIVGYEGLYKISDDGKIISLFAGKIKERRIRIKDGYYLITLCKDNSNKTYPIHRLIYEAFIAPIDKNKVIDHIDRNRMNNSLSNLRVVTQSENAKNRNGKGVKLDKRSGKWEARIRVDRKYIHLGSFDTKDSARLAYIRAKETYHSIILPE